MNERDWARDLSNYLQQSFRRLCRSARPVGPVGELRASIHRSQWRSAKHFLMAIGARPLSHRRERTPKSESLSPSRHTINSEQVLGPIFAHDSIPTATLFVKISASSPPLHAGVWNVVGFRVRSDGNNRSYAISSGIDMIVESAGGRMLVCVEIKRSAHELQKFRNDFRRCCRCGCEHAKADCAFQQNHEMHEYCVSYRPPYLWIVAPEADVCYEFIYRSAMIEMNELDTLPPRSHIEFGLEQSGA